MQRTHQTAWEPSESLAVGAVRGAAATAAGTAGRFAAQLAATVVVARLLGPEAYGFAAVSVLLGGIAELVRSGGIAALVARAPRLDGATASLLHVLSCAVGGVVAALVAIVSGPVAALAGFPDHGLLVLVLGLAFVPAGFACVPGALLVRNLRLGALSSAEVVATVLGAAAAVTIAALGGGPVALVVQFLVFSVLTAAAIWGRCPWRPGRPTALRRLRSELGFAANVSGVQVLTFISRNVDRVLVGAAFGRTAAGLYAQASQLVALPLEQVAAPMQRVAVPVLARVLDDRERFVRYYRRILGTVALVLWPLLALLVVGADHLVHLLFGPAWAGSVPLFRLLAIAGIAQTIGTVTVWVFTATGQGVRQTIWALVSRPLVAGAGFAGLPFGTEGVAVGVSTAALVLVVPGYLLAARRAGLRLRDLVAPLGAPTLVALAAAGGAIGTAALVAAAGPLAGCSAIGGAGIVAAAFVVLVVPRLRHESGQLFAAVLRRRSTLGVNA